MTPEPERNALAESWLAAMADDRVVKALEGVYARAAAAIAARGPACWASGRCCNFDAAGHRLYVTGLEAAYCAVRLAGTEWDRAASEVGAGSAGLTVLGGAGPLPPLPTGRGLPADLEAALARGGCPFQVRNLCGVHAIKPLGCRVYFCDKSAQAWQGELSERLLGEIRGIHDRFAVPYRYGEWRAMLGMFHAPV